MGARTPSQTVGPFFHVAMGWPDGIQVAAAAAGTRVVLHGRVLDGAGAPVTDAMVEAWQTDPAGLGRALSDAQGAFRFETAMPRGPAPCLDVRVFARGLLKPVRTRAYLAPPAVVQADPALAALRGSPRLATLVATPEGEGQFRWDVRLQGEAETAFFAE